MLERLHRLDDVDGVAVYGGPREELARLGKELDLLIVGSRGYGPRGHVFHGSVSNYLVSHADCPLLVLPRSLLEEDAEEQHEDRSQTAVAPAPILPTAALLPGLIAEYLDRPQGRFVYWRGEITSARALAQAFDRDQPEGSPDV